MAGPFHIAHRADRIGILAGGGSLPLEIARSVTGRGGSVHIVIIDGEADNRALTSFPHTRLSWSELGGAIKALRRAGMRDIVCVGKMARPSLRTARPDLGFILAFPLIVRALSAGGDDALLRGILALFTRRGFNVVGPADVAPELLIGDGSIGLHSPSAQDEHDMALALAVIAALGRFDIGQAAIVSGGRIEAIEGAEGTDGMLVRVREARAAEARDGAAQRRGVLVKRPKPGQDLRVDLPAIGPDTVQRAAEAGLAGIAAMTGHVLAANRTELVERADRAGLFVTGVEGGALTERLNQPGRAAAAAPIYFGGNTPSAKIAADVDRGMGVMSTLDSFGSGTALVACRRRVLAIGSDEKPADVMLRAKRFIKLTRQRQGVVVVGSREPLDAELINAAADAGFAGIIAMYSSAVGPQHMVPMIDLAQKRGLFIGSAEIAKMETAP
jgi:DUF1009 family protein